MDLAIGTRVLVACLDFLSRFSDIRVQFPTPGNIHEPGSLVRARGPY